MAPLPQLYEGSEIGLGAGLGIRERLPPALPSTILSDAGSADCADEGDLLPSGAPTERLADPPASLLERSVRLARRLPSGAVAVQNTGDHPPVSTSAPFAPFRTRFVAAAPSQELTSGLASQSRKSRLLPGPQTNMLRSCWQLDGMMYQFRGSAYEEDASSASTADRVASCSLRTWSGQARRMEQGRRP
jgi:hypothetical protein